MIRKLLSLLVINCALLFCSMVYADTGYIKPDIQHAAYGNLKIVMPVATSDHHIQEMELRNIANTINTMKQWQGTVTVRVVVYAAGVSLLETPTPPMKQQMAALRKAGVNFYVCNNTLHERNIDYHTLEGIDAAHVVPGGVLEIAWLQTQGYVLVPV